MKLSPATMKIILGNGIFVIYQPQTIITAPWRQNNHPDTTEASPDFNKKQLPFLPNLPASVQLGDEVGGIQVWWWSLILLKHVDKILPSFLSDMVRSVRHRSDERDHGRRAKSLLYDPHTFHASQEQVSRVDILTRYCLSVIVFVTVFVSVLKTAKHNYDFCGRTK